MSSILTKEEKEKIVSESFSIAECLRKMKRSSRGGNYKTFHRYRVLYNLDVSHFTGQKTNIGNKNNQNSTKPVEFYLHKNCHTTIKSKKLINMLIESGYKNNECECCHITEWCGKQITFQLHHIDGDHYNNELENLQVLCPNCHSQTENFCGKKLKRNKKKYCKDCGKEISKYSKSGLCNKCVQKLQIKTEHPDKETLYDILKETSFCETARMYGVSDNTIRKWCRKLGLSDKAKDYK